RNRVVVVGSRAEFERSLSDCCLIPRSGMEGITQGSLVDTLPWGGFNTGGMPIVINPPGAGGQPMVAISRDMLALEAASLNRHVSTASQIIITDRFDLILRNLDLAGRLGERQRLVLFADASRREDALNLQRQGWLVWEPSPGDLLPSDGTSPPDTMMPALDRI